MNMIQVLIFSYDFCENGEWMWVSCGRGFCGLSFEDAKKEIATLRRWAVEDESRKRYRIVDCILIPQ